VAATVCIVKIYSSSNGVVVVIVVVVVLLFGRQRGGEGNL